MRLIKSVCSLLLLLATALAATAASFTPGNLVVVRVGSGTGSLANTGNPVFLDEYTTAGVLVQSVALPTAAAGANNPFALGGTASTEGMMTRSADGKFLVLAGYASAPGAASSLQAATSAAVPRAVAVISAAGTIDTTTSLTNYASASSPRGAASTDGTTLWLTSGVGGVFTTTKGTAGTATIISTDQPNLRNAGIFGGQLYVSSGAGAFRLATVGTGTSTNTGQTTANLNGITTPASPYGFFFADLDAGVAGVDTVYMADDASTGTIYKYCLVGGTWTACGTITAVTSVRGLTGSVSGSSVTLYGTSGSTVAAGGGNLYKLTDTSGYNATINASFTVAANTISTAAANTTFRGIAFAPENPVVLPAVASTTPAASAVGVATNSAVTVTFNQAVTVSAGGITLASSLNGAVAATVATTNNTTYTVTPSAPFTLSDTITATVLAANVVDQATGLVHPAANYVFSFTTAAPVAPSIVTAPQAQTVLATGTATFTVAATGTAPLAYQWLKDDQPITGNSSATTATLTLTNVQAANAGAYSVVVSNGTLPNATSTPVALTVTPVAPSITTQPLARTVVEGANVTFTVAATGSTPFTYVWRKGGEILADGGNISGATTASLTLTGVTLADSGNYDVVVANGTSPAATSSLVALLVSAALPGPQIDYAGGTYVQNFNTLPSAGTFTLSGNGPIDASAASPAGVGATGMPGWSFSNYSGSGNNVIFLVGTGSVTNGAVYSFGSAGASDRALGSIASAAQIGRFGLALVNTTGQTITHFTLGYTGEQWRTADNTTPQSLTFSYSVSASNINTGTFTNVPALTFTSPIASATASALDGNLPANRTVIAPVTITGVAWLPGQTLTLRWTDLNDGGNDHALAIDDFIFALEAVPPTITTQPMAQTATALTQVTFTTAADGTAPLSYQWRKGGIALTGNASATTATLVLPSVTAADAGGYDCVVSNNFGTVTTAAAALTVNKLAVEVSLADRTAEYDGTAKPVTPTVGVGGLNVVVTYNGSTTAPIAAGAYAAVATVNDPAYAGAASATVTIVKAPLTVIVNPATKVYGTANPAFSVRYTGFVNNETAAVVSGAPVLATAAGTSSPVGTYPITVGPGTLAASNYTLNTDSVFSAGTLTITKAVLAVTASNQSRLYGAANATPTATFTGFLGNDSLANAVTGTPALSHTAVTGSPVGTYPIDAAIGTLASANYDFTFTGGTLTVGKAPLTVTAAAKTRAYGAANPALTATITGFVNGDGVSVVTGTAALSTTATTASDIGTYPITAAIGTLAATNYSFATFVPAQLTVTAAAITVELSGLAQTYDGQPKPVTVTTTPAGIATTVTYAQSATVPTNAGSYPVAAQPTSANYSGSASGTLVIGKASQTIAFPALGNLRVGTAVTLAATASSGLSVSFEVVSGNASIGGGQLTVQDNQAVVVRATQAGNSNYNAAEPVSQTTTGATRLDQSITFAQPAEHFTTDQPFALSASASSGLPVTFTVVSGPATLNTVRPTGAGPGTQALQERGAAVTVASSTLTLNGTAGTVVVRASQAGNNSYTAAADITRSITITARGPQVFFGQFGGQGPAEVGASAVAVGGGFAVNLARDGQDSTLIGYLPGSGDGVVVKFRLAADGTFSATTTSIANPGQATLNESHGSGGRSAAVATTLTFTGQVTGGVLYGNITELSLPFTATFQADTGPEANLAGFYQAAPLNAASGNVYTIVAADGSAFVLAVSPTYVGGGTGTVAANGTFSIATAASGVVSGSVNPTTTAVTGTLTLPGQAAQAFSGLGTDTPRTDRLINLSSRARIFANAGNSTSITGFVIGGTAPKQVLLRAMGPALTPLGVIGAAADPQLRVFNSAGAIIAENNDWGGGSTLASLFTALGASALPAGSKDAAVVATLAPGSYSMHVFTTGTAGVALSEIYDASADPGAESQRLVNVSSRGDVGTGENVLITGFVVTGNSPKRILIRGVGPGIAAALGGTLADPFLRVYSSGTVIAQNNDWQTPLSAGTGQTLATAAELSAAAAQTGAAALAAGSKDAALIVTLAPGVYSAMVSGVGNTTGVALVEVYEIPQ
jgi:hypothetical protein